MKIIYGQEERLLPWASARLRGQMFRSDAVAIGCERDGKIAGVTVFDTHSPNSCLLHVASDLSRRWVSREFMIHVMAYAFGQCGYHRLTCCVSEHNAASLNFTRRFGWTEEGRLREQGLDGEDYILFGLLARECSWQFGYGNLKPKALSIPHPQGAAMMEGTTS